MPSRNSSDETNGFRNTITIDLIPTAPQKLNQYPVSGSWGAVQADSFQHQPSDELTTKATGIHVMAVIAHPAPPSSVNMVQRDKIPRAKTFPGHAVVLTKG